MEAVRRPGGGDRARDNRAVAQRPIPDSRNDLTWQRPASTRERWSAGAYIASITVIFALVVLAIVFDQFAATGVLLVSFLSVVLVYLLAPAVEWLRHHAAPWRRGRPPSRALTTLSVYGILAAVMLPLWTFSGTRASASLERARVVVPEHTARFVDQLRATEGWHETLNMPSVVAASVGAVTRRLTRDVEEEAQALGAELAEISGLVPWLSTVPVVAFVLLTRWHRIRRSTVRVLPTPHLRWRGDEFLRNLDSVLAAYTRAQALSALIVGSVCWVGFAAIGLPYPGTLGLIAGLLETLPLAGPIIAAVVAAAAAPDRVVPVLVFLAALRAVQDYLIYPRLIKRTLHLHPLAVVVAIWAGAALGGVVGVCLAIPVVGIVKAAYRHWRDYRAIEGLVANRQAAPPVTSGPLLP
jgi:predicted PurR-regulated permease PerM